MAAFDVFFIEGGHGTSQSHFDLWPNIQAENADAAAVIVAKNLNKDKVTFSVYPADTSRVITLKKTTVYQEAN